MASVSTFGVGLLSITLAGCATTGATYRSGVGDRFLEHPPYYAGNPVVASDSVRVGHFPVHYQRGASQAAIFDPVGDESTATAVGKLVAEMSAYLDSLGVTARLMPSGLISAMTGTAPNVYFGCQRDATDDCEERGDSVLGRRGTTMRLAVERPSPTWIASSAAVLDRAGATHALLITLEVGQYWLRQSGLRGSKSVELGSAHTAPVQWLTSVETPVSVVQLTGALLRRDGTAVRIGAEGILAQRTPLVASAIGAQRLISEEDVARARAARRDELPGQPLAWQVALRHLVSQLTGKVVPGY